MWIAEKFQSNSEIAGSPRNSFRASLERSLTEVKHSTDAGPKKVTNSYQTKNAVKIPSGVSLREISRVDKRERAQTDS